MDFNLSHEMELQSEPKGNQLPPQPVKDLGTSYEAGVRALLREAEALSDRDKFAAVKLCLDSASIPAELAGASPLRLPYLPAIRTAERAVTAAARKERPLGLLHLFPHSFVPLEHGVLAQWYAPPPLLEETVQKILADPQSPLADQFSSLLHAGSSATAIAAAVGSPGEGFDAALAFACPRIDETTATSAIASSEASGPEVVDSFGTLFVGPRFSAWLKGVAQAFDLAADLLGDLADAIMLVTPAKGKNSSASSFATFAEELKDGSSFVVETVLKVAAFCGYVPWSTPAAAKAAQRLMCALAKAEAAVKSTSKSTGVKPPPFSPCPLCRKRGISAPPPPVHPVIPRSSDFGGGEGNDDNGSSAATREAPRQEEDEDQPLVEMTTCAHTLVACHADALLTRARALMAGDAWCSINNDGEDDAGAGSTASEPKKNPLFPARHVAFWVATHLKSPHIDFGRLTGQCLPIFLKLLDRWEATNVWLGASGLCHLLWNAFSSDLRIHRDLLMDSLNRTKAVTKSATALHALYFAKCLALPVLYGPPPALPSPKDFAASSSASGIKGAPGTAVGLHAQMARALNAIAATSSSSNKKGPSAAAAATGGKGTEWIVEAHELLSEAFMGAAGTGAGGSTTAMTASTLSFVSPYDLLLEDVTREITVSLSNPARAYCMLSLLPIAMSYVAAGTGAGTGIGAGGKNRLDRHLHLLISLAARIMTDSSDASLVLLACNLARACVVLSPGSFRPVPAPSSSSSSSSSSASASSSAAAAMTSLANRFVAQLLSAAAVAKEQLLVGLAVFRGPHGQSYYGSQRGKKEKPEDQKHEDEAIEALVSAALSYGRVEAGEESDKTTQRPEPEAVRAAIFCLQHFDALTEELDALNPTEVDKALKGLEEKLNEAAVTASAATDGDDGDEKKNE